MSSLDEVKLDAAAHPAEPATLAADLNIAQLAGGDEPEDEEEASLRTPGTRERRKIEIKFIHDKSRRHITFSKRKAGIMKKAYELLVLTGTQVLLLVVLETGLVYTFTTPKLQPLVTKPEGKNLIQACLNAPEEAAGDEGEGGEPELPPAHPLPPQMAGMLGKHDAGYLLGMYQQGNYDNNAAYQQYFNQMQNGGQGYQ